MSLGLTLTIIFGIVFSITLFVGFLYEKEFAEFERILVKYIRLKIQAKKAGMSVEEYAEMKKMKKASKTVKAEKPSNIIYLDNWVA